MRGSIKIGTAFGIAIRMHWTFLLLVMYIVPASPDPLQVLLQLCTVFAVVLLHELGHSLVAMRFGIKVLDITFWPLGGMARMSEIPEKPRIEFLVAIAGPAVNFVLAGLTVGMMIVLGMGSYLLSGDLVDPGPFFSGLVFFLVINLMLGTFNLLPAFPMDGGRVLRAWLARKHDWVLATEKAVRVGRWVALGMVLVPLTFRSSLSCSMSLIAAFVWFAGGRELFAVRMRHAGKGLGAMFGGMGRGGGQAGPFGPSDPTGQPGPAGPAGPGGSGQSGYSEDDVKRMENFRGRLRGPGPHSD